MISAASCRRRIFVIARAADCSLLMTHSLSSFFQHDSRLGARVDSPPSSESICSRKREKAKKKKKAREVRSCWRGGVRTLPQCAYVEEVSDTRLRPYTCYI